MAMQIVPRGLMSCALILGSSTGLAAELKPETVEAFDAYVEATEERMQTEVDGAAPFLWVDRAPADERAALWARLRAGEVVIEPLETRRGGDEIDIPSGMVHHWVGTVHIPGVGLDRTIAMVEDYERYAEIYEPDVRAGRVLERDGNRYRVYLQLYTKKVITWLANTQHDVEFIRLDPRRAYVPSRSASIRELENADTPNEREKPEGNDRGFAWRLNNYCSFEERDGGTVMQCESITLTRGVPFLLAPIVRPFVSGVPREKLTFTLEAARRHLTGAAQAVPDP